jgi:DedD protein
MVRNSGDFQSLQSPPVSASALQENRFYINNDSTQPLLIERQEGGNTRVVINVPRPEAAAVPGAPPVSQPSSAPAARPATGTQTNRNTTASGKSAGSGSNTAQRTAAAPARTTAPAARPAPQARQSGNAYSAFWVQTGSFPTRTQADKAKEILAAKGLTAVIENGNVRGETWYRVRVGPYTSQNEADYWLSLIKSINGKPHIDLASSIVWKSNASR